MAAPEVPAETATRPCWWVKTNAPACATATTLELHVERTTPGTAVEVGCAPAPAT